MAGSGRRTTDWYRVGELLLFVPASGLDHAGLAGCPSGQRERSVKPSASPTLVRTQHLPQNENYRLTRGDDIWRSALGIRLYPRCTELLRLVFPYVFPRVLPRGSLRVASQTRWSASVSPPCTHFAYTFSSTATLWP